MIITLAEIDEDSDPDGVGVLKGTPEFDADTETDTVPVEVDDW